MFHDLRLLGLALSLKTVANFALSFQVPFWLQRFGVRRGLITAQCFGLASLVVLALGFHFEIATAVLAGIVLCALPAPVSTIALLATFRLHNAEPETFRRYSGFVEIARALALLSAAVAVPFALSKGGLHVVFVFDAFTYLGAMAVIVFGNSHFSLAAPDAKPRLVWANLFRERATYLFLVATAAPLLFLAFPPLFASSSRFDGHISFPEWMRGSLWSIDAVALFFGGSLYARFHRWLDPRFARVAIMLNALLFVAMAYCASAALHVAIVLANCFLTAFAFLRFRDDFILRGEFDPQVVSSHTAFIYMWQSAMAAISPLVLTGVYGTFGPSRAAWILLGVQLPLAGAAIVLGKKK